MIHFLDGKVDEFYPTHVVLDVQGVGYYIAVPLSTADKIPAVGARVRLLTHFEVREDAHLLFGFLTSEERDLFRLLLQHVTGVGPKLALAILSGMPVPHFKDAVVRGDSAALSKISGVGKKTAERIILELRDKVGVTAVWRDSQGASPSQGTANDATLALIALGYKQAEASKVVHSMISQHGATTSVEELVRYSLRHLM